MPNEYSPDNICFKRLQNIVWLWQAHTCSAQASNDIIGQQVVLLRHTKVEGLCEWRIQAKRNEYK